MHFSMLLMQPRGQVECPCGPVRCGLFQEQASHLAVHVAPHKSIAKVEEGQGSPNKKGLGILSPDSKVRRSWTPGFCQTY